MSKIEVNGITLNYTIEGEGFPLICLHGLSDDLNYWINLDEKFSKKFKVIKIDLRGHGQSELGDEKITMDLMTDDIYKLTKHLEIKECHLIGFSLGGCIGINLAEKYPNLVKKLVLISTYAKLNENSKNCLKNFEKSLDISFERFFDTIINYVVPIELYNKYKDYFEELKIEKSKITDKNCLKKIIAINYDFDGEKDLDLITAKSMIICAKNDKFIDPELSIKINEKIKDSKLIKLNYIKHNPFVEGNIEKMNDILLEFLLEEQYLNKI